MNYKVIYGKNWPGSMLSGNGWLTTICVHWEMYIKRLFLRA